MASEPTIHSFPPVVDERTRVLILGSMPGEASLRMRQYYAFSRNQFWPIMFALYELPQETDYARRLQVVAARGIGLWDVLASCRRPGSLDQHITDAEPNDFARLFERCPQIRYICFNGQTAYNAYKRHVGLDHPRIADYAVLPSTSPAHTMRFERKLEQWEVVRRYAEQDGRT